MNCRRKIQNACSIHQQTDFFLKFSKQPRNRRKTWCEGRHLVLLVYRLYVHQYCFFLNMWRYLCVKETTEYLILVATTLGTFGSKFNINISNEFIKIVYKVLVKIRNTGRLFKILSKNSIVDV